MLTFAEWREQSAQMPTNRAPPWVAACPAPTSTLPAAGYERCALRVNDPAPYPRPSWGVFEFDGDD